MAKNIDSQFNWRQTALSHLPYWFNFTLLLSFICLLVPQQQSAEHLNISMFDLTVGFFLQLPLVLFIVALEIGLFQLLKLTPFNPTLKFVSRVILTYLFILFYIASTIIYAALGVFISFEVIKIFFLDFNNISAIMITSAGLPLLLCLILIIILVTISRLIAKRLPRLTLELPIKLFIFYCISFVLALSYSLIEKNNNPSFTNNVFKNSFPPTYLLGQVIESAEQADIQLERLSEITLNPQISMAEYKQQNGELAATPPVIFIMLESISHNHLGFTGYHRQDITPNLDKIFAQSTFFDRTYTPSNHSNLSQGSILSSQYSLRRIRLETFKEINYVKPMLFDILHEYGYETAIYSAQDEDWLGMRRFIESNDAKIDHFKHAHDFDQYHRFFDGKIDDADLVTEVGRYLTELRNPEQPQFLYVNLQRTHYDYRLKPSIKGKYGEPDRKISGTFFNYGEDQADTALLMYDNALNYVDEQVGVLFNTLKQHNMYDDAIIIITADHGEAFYEKGYPTHATSMYDPQIRTFTSVKLPQQNTAVYRQDAISSVDIMPMALEALGLKNHPAFQGFQLLNTQRSNTQPIFSTGQSLIRADAVVSYPWKFYLSEKEGAVLLNLEKDYKEEHNLNYSLPKQVSKMQSMLLQYRQHQTDYYIHNEQRVRDNFYAPQYK